MTKRKQKQHTYNLEKLESIIMVALIADQKCVYVPKSLYKVTKQLLTIKGLNSKLKIKTY
jgi:hypothetical protein